MSDVTYETYEAPELGLPTGDNLAERIGFDVRPYDYYGDENRWTAIYAVVPVYGRGKSASERVSTALDTAMKQLSAGVVSHRGLRIADRLRVDIVHHHGPGMDTFTFDRSLHWLRWTLWCC